MQINLNEADIIEAIEAHVRSKVNFDEGVEVVIDLKATRGPEGFTATIDLGSPAPKTEKAVRTPRKAAEPKAPEPEAAPVVAEAAPAAETAQEAADEPAATEAPSAPAQAEAAEEVTDAAQPEQSSEADAVTATDEVPEKPRSLFGNLQKPKN